MELPMCLLKVNNIFLIKGSLLPKRFKPLPTAEPGKMFEGAELRRQLTNGKNGQKKWEEVIAILMVIELL
jgi:hypothetical protein